MQLFGSPGFLFRGRRSRLIAGFRDTFPSPPLRPLPPYPLMNTDRPGILALASLSGGLLLFGATAPRSVADDDKPAKVERSGPPGEPGRADRSPDKAARNGGGGGNRNKRPTQAPEGPDDPFRDLTSEQRDRLREAVRRAWNDPAVIQARGEVKAATDAYQSALREALVRTDPDIAGLVEKFRLSTQSESKGYLAPGMGNGRGPGGSPGPNPGFPGLPGGGGRDWRGGFEGFLLLENPPFLRDLDDGKKQLYRDAHRKALENPDVNRRLDTLKALRQEDDEIRKKRTEAIRGVHQALHRALIEADPRVVEFLPKNFDDRRPPGGEGGGHPEPPAPPGPVPPPPPR